MIDTARIYTGGESEGTIGAALSPMPQGCVAATKGGYAPGHGRPEVLRAQIEESLRRLRTDRIELYYLHRVDPQTPFEESLGALKDAVDAGSIRHVGLSQVDVDQIERARCIVPIAAVQNHYNLSERTYEDVVDHCAGEGIVFVPYYPLGGEGGAALAEIAERHGATPAQIALAWLLAQKPWIVPIPGTTKLHRLDENIGAAAVDLTSDDLREIESTTSRITIEGARYPEQLERRTGL
jgi:aryl-alcohol dehydrogenase-like predicted oxidoreductase